MLPTHHYFSNAVGSVDYVPHAYVYLHWSGMPLTSLEFRALYVHMRNLLQRFQLTAVVADHHAMPEAPAAADREWLLRVWLPQTVAETPFARYAVVPAPDPAHRLHTAGVLHDLSCCVTVRVFEEAAQACQWTTPAR